MRVAALHIINPPLLPPVVNCALCSALLNTLCDNSSVFSFYCPSLSFNSFSFERASSVHKNVASLHFVHVCNVLFPEHLHVWCQYRNMCERPLMGWQLNYIVVSVFTAAVERQHFFNR